MTSHKHKNKDNTTTVAQSLMPVVSLCCIFGENNVTSGTNSVTWGNNSANNI